MLVDDPLLKVIAATLEEFDEELGYERFVTAAVALDLAVIEVGRQYGSASIGVSCMVFPLTSTLVRGTPPPQFHVEEVVNEVTTLPPV